MDRGDHGTEATNRQNEKSKHRMASNGRSRRISHRDHGLGACRTGSTTGDSFTSSVYQCRRIVSALDVLVQCDLESPSSIPRRQRGAKLSSWSFFQRPVLNTDVRISYCVTPLLSSPCQGS